MGLRVAETPGRHCPCREMSWGRDSTMPILLEGNNARWRYACRASRSYCRPTGLAISLFIPIFIAMLAPFPMA
ncbi:hypothetical protein KCP77_18840 [Salmonella enterica subsp. enterica]|nr:hypothetical protein KCP77_18840 [Salmonella enterica subsp. enterica]